MKKRLLIIALAALLFSCSKDDTKSIVQEIDTNYFFMDSGFYKVYKVKTIVVDAPINIYDTNEFLVKETYTGMYKDASGDSSMRVERVYRDDDTQLWKPLTVWSADIKEIRAIQTEENVKYVKIVFPVEIGKEWDGNAFNREDTLGAKIYEITSVDVPHSVEVEQFERVLTVLQEYDSSLVKKVNDYEQYAYGVGLIYKQSVNLNSQDIDPGVPIEDRLRTGVSRFEELIEYGYEK